MACTMCVLRWTGVCLKKRVHDFGVGRQWWTAPVCGPCQRHWEVAEKFDGIESSSVFGTCVGILCFVYIYGVLRLLLAALGLLLEGQFARAGVEFASAIGLALYLAIQPRIIKGTSRSTKRKQVGSDRLRMILHLSEDPGQGAG